MRCEPGKIGCLGERKMGARLVTMHTHETPAGTTGDEYCTQFVSQSEGSQDFSVALATLQLTLGGLHQVHNRRVASGHPGELVHVVLQKLVLNKLGAGAHQNIVKHRSREEQRRRINGAEKGKIDRDDGLEPLQYFDPKRAGVESSMTEPDQLTPDLFCSALLHGDPPGLVLCADHGFLSPLIIHAACAQNHPRFLGLSLQHADSMLAADK